MSDAATEEESQRVYLLPLFTAYVVKYSNRENKIHHAELVKDITSECNVMLLREIFIYY